MVAYRIDRTTLATALDALTSAQQGITEELDRLDARVAQVQGQWTGEARDAFSSAHARWTAQLREMNGVLARAVATGRATHDRYTDAGREIDRIWGIG